MNTPELRIIDWNALDADARRVVLQRPPQARDEQLITGVARIIAQVRAVCFTPPLPALLGRPPPMPAWTRVN